MKESFSSMADPRQRSQVRHDLYEIIAMAMAAMKGICDGWDEIVDSAVFKIFCKRANCDAQIIPGA